MLDEHTHLVVTKLGPYCLARLTLQYPVTAHPSVLHPVNVRRVHCVYGGNAWHPLDSCIGGEWMDRGTDEGARAKDYLKWRGHG